MKQQKTNLAVRMRPNKIEDVIGQQHLLGENKVLRRMVESNSLTSLILFGPPGTGKTSIANALSGSLGLEFHRFNASIHGKKELQEYAKIVSKQDEPIVILVDEIHRLTRPNQDFLLPYMEEGSFIIIGATTDNPYITVAPAIRSRSQIYQVHPLTQEDIVKALIKANKKEFGLDLDEYVLLFMAKASQGDLRTAYTYLEILAKSARNNTITVEEVEELTQTKYLGSDKGGDIHYNIISALQKSIRGSDVNASLHYLARLIQAGDLVSICRRLLVIAYEDIGVARPEITSLTYQAIQTAQQVGFPEARIPLSFIVIELALSPKSNIAYKAIDQAIEDLGSITNPTIPIQLQDNHYKGAPVTGYKYPHDYPGQWVKQQYMPEELRNIQYIVFNDSKAEREKDLAKIAEYYYKQNKS